MTTSSVRRRARVAVGVLAVDAAAFAGLLTLNFALPRAMPGDPVDALFAAGSPDLVADERLRAALAAYYGLDRPPVEQFGHYLAGLVTGDWGVSIRDGVPVTGLLAERLPWTALLVGTALLLGGLVGVLLGAVAGWRRGSRLDTAFVVVAAAVRAVPVFVTGSALIAVFAVWLGWFPLSGTSTRFADPGPIGHLSDIAAHLALPAFTLGLPFAAAQFLLMRAAMVGELGSDHLLAGRAAGLPWRVLRRRYAARTALPPVIAAWGVALGTAVTATVLVETVFRYAGVGLLMSEAINYRDYPVLQGCFVLLTVGVLVTGRLADLVHRCLDPRVRR
ncbi:ABC transporter permease [Saccharopolyspora sp. CA-218241]|uniref:ABC transporter permease n=1 Tax=Saccharopolyspora sp. CA-218241 TaxID=3240027 RepID=UPI003D9974F7